MSRWRLYYHLVWATHQREMLITPTIENDIYAYLGEKCQEQRGLAYAINGMPDHVHLIVNIPPTMAVAMFVKNLKGSSSHFVTGYMKHPFRWQAGYNALTISERNLHQAIDYVRNQKSHHHAGKIYPHLENIPTISDGE